MRLDLQKTMQAHAAVYRNSASLKEGVAKMKTLWTGLDDMKVSDRSLIWNSDLVEALELSNLMGNAMTTIVSADARMLGQAVARATREKVGRVRAAGGRREPAGRGQAPRHRQGLLRGPGGPGPGPVPRPHRSHGGHTRSGRDPRRRPDDDHFPASRGSGRPADHGGAGGLVLGVLGLLRGTPFLVVLAAFLVLESTPAVAWIAQARSAARVMPGATARPAGMRQTSQRRVAVGADVEVGVEDVPGGIGIPSCLPCHAPNGFPLLGKHGRRDLVRHPSVGQARHPPERSVHKPRIHRLPDFIGHRRRVVGNPNRHRLLHGAGLDRHAVHLIVPSLMRHALLGEQPANENDPFLQAADPLFGDDAHGSVLECLGRAHFVDLEGARATHLLDELLRERTAPEGEWRPSRDFLHHLFDAEEQEIYAELIGFAVTDDAFHIVMPDVAVFGQKDLQQVAAVKAMVRDLNFPVGILVAPTIREPDGLAMSSRNRYLSPKDRELGLILSKALFAVRDAFTRGERRASALEAIGWRMLERVVGLTPRYLAVVNADTFQRVNNVRHGDAAVGAIRVGETKLIDNIIF